MPKYEHDQRPAQTAYAFEAEALRQERLQRFQQRQVLRDIELVGARKAARDTALLQQIQAAAPNWLAESDHDYDGYEYDGTETEYAGSDFEDYDDLAEESDEEYVYDPAVEAKDISVFKVEERAMGTYAQLANQFVDLKKFVASLSDKYTAQKEQDYSNSSYLQGMFKSPKPNPARLKQINDLKMTVKMFDKMEALTREPVSQQDFVEYADDIRSANRVIQGAIINLHDSLTSSSYDSQLAAVLKPVVSECSDGVRQAAEQAFKEYNHSIANMKATDSAISYSVRI